MFLTNSNQRLLTKCCAFNATYFEHTAQGNLTFLPSEIAHLPTETGSVGDSDPRTPPLARGLAFS